MIPGKRRKRIPKSSEARIACCGTAPECHQCRSRDTPCVYLKLGPSTSSMTIVHQAEEDQLLHPPPIPQPLSHIQSMHYQQQQSIQNQFIQSQSIQSQSIQNQSMQQQQQQQQQQHQPNNYSSPILATAVALETARSTVPATILPKPSSNAHLLPPESTRPHTSQAPRPRSSSSKTAFAYAAVRQRMHVLSGIVDGLESRIRSLMRIADACSSSKPNTMDVSHLAFGQCGSRASVEPHPSGSRLHHDDPGQDATTNAFHQRHHRLQKCRSHSSHASTAASSSFSGDNTSLTLSPVLATGGLSCPPNTLPPPTPQLSQQGTPLITQLTPQSQAQSQVQLQTRTGSLQSHWLQGGASCPLTVPDMARQKQLQKLQYDHRQSQIRQQQMEQHQPQSPLFSHSDLSTSCTPKCVYLTASQDLSHICSHNTCRHSVESVGDIMSPCQSTTAWPVTDTTRSLSLTTTPSSLLHFASTHTAGSHATNALPMHNIEKLISNRHIRPTLEQSPCNQPKTYTNIPASSAINPTTLAKTDPMQYFCSPLSITTLPPMPASTPTSSSVPIRDSIPALSSSTAFLSGAPRPKGWLKPQELPNAYSGLKIQSVSDDTKEEPSLAPVEMSRSMLMSVFFMHVWPEFPILNHAQFLESEMAKSELLTLAMCCNAAKFIDPPNEDFNGDSKESAVRYNAGDRHFYKAIRMIGTAIMETSSYENILAFYYLSGYAAASGRVSSGLVLFSTAVRFAQLIGLDNERRNPNSYKWSPEERELRRRIWWMLYEGDRYTSTSGRIPMIIAVSSPLKTPFPCPDKLIHMVTPASSIPTSSQAQAFPYRPSGLLDLFSQPLVLSSSTPILPSIASYRITIVMILSRAYVLTMEEYDANLDPLVSCDIESFSQQRSAISRDLLLFRHSLPEWITNVSSYVSSSTHFTDSQNFSRCLPSDIPLDSKTAVQIAGATVLIFYNHTYICLFMLHFYRLNELGMYSNILSDHTFASSVEAALEICEIARWIMRTPMHLFSPPPTLCKGLATAACILHLAQSVGFMGINMAMRDEMLDVFDSLLKPMLMFWIWPVKAIHIIKAIRNNSYTMDTQTPIWI
ncbi:hypothetical protein BASA62_005749 [Batrachochytrium salamandrivorans]|nr:hypothetical protein BASA62_005749 [Batrachochytrium salamandrivorans]